MISLHSNESKRQYRSSFVRLVVLVYALAIAAYGSAQDEPPEIPPEIQERLDRLTAPPPTHYKAEVGRYIFEIPVEYIRQIPPNTEMFHIMTYWPGLVAYKNTEREGYHGVINITARPGDIEELEQVAYSHQDRIMASGRNLVSDAVVQGLTSSIDRFVESSQFHFDEDIESVLSQDILMILCGSPRGVYKVGACSTRFSPIPGIVVRMQFDRSTLPEWREMISQTTQLLMNFKEE